MRANASAAAYYGDDLTLLGLVTHGSVAVIVPKAESAAALARVAAAVAPACALLPLIESVTGLDAIDALAAYPQVLRLAFGHLDFQADTSLACGPVETELVPVRLVLASRRAGFGGKLCIHPAQVAVVNAAFAPSTAELDWARRVAAAFAAAACSALMAAWWTHRCCGSRGKRWRLCAEVVCPNVSRNPLLQNGGVDEREDFLNLLC